MILFSAPIVRMCLRASDLLIIIEMIEKMEKKAENAMEKNLKKA